MRKPFNRKTAKILAAGTLVAAALASATTLQAQDGAKQPRGMMMQGGNMGNMSNMGMMGMMAQMNRMMANCNRMMERAMQDESGKSPGATPPKAPAEKKG